MKYAVRKGFPCAINISSLWSFSVCLQARFSWRCPIDHPAWLEEGLASGRDTQRDIRELTLGLDLKGGTQVLLEAEIDEDQPLAEDALASAKIIVEQRVNGLGLAEPTVQLQGERRMIVELPGVKNPDQAIQTIRSTGQLEFVNLGGLGVPA